MNEAELDNSVVHDARVTAFWNDFCRQAAIDPATPYQAWYFGSGAEMAHGLADLVVHGPKRATAALGWVADKYPHAAAVPDGYSVVTELDGTPRCVIRTVWLERRAFRDVDAQFAWDEGEGDRTLADWKDAHWSYFSRECAALGREMTQDVDVVLERFELLYADGRLVR
jgi:uncharacterized protein YhfF